MQTVAVNMAESLNPTDAAHVARGLYLDNHGRGLWRRLRTFLAGRRGHLLRLADLEQEHFVLGRYAGGWQRVPVREIQGSEGRSGEFDAEFRPLNHEDEERWQGVAQALYRGESLPPVELIYAGGVYYVRDGHRRVSVAKAFGYDEIEANVTVWQLSDAATVSCVHCAAAAQLCRERDNAPAEPKPVTLDEIIAPNGVCACALCMPGTAEARGRAGWGF